MSDTISDVHASLAPLNTAQRELLLIALSAWMLEVQPQSFHAAVGRVIQATNRITRA